LAAKPKIDIIAVVRNLFFDKTQLEAIGYKYRGGFNIGQNHRLLTIDKNIKFEMK
jgi:hypothetical protein